MVSMLALIGGVLMIQRISCQAEQCDCDDEYGSPFCDGIQNKLAFLACK